LRAFATLTQLPDVFDVHPFPFCLAFALQKSLPANLARIDSGQQLTLGDGANPSGSAEPTAFHKKPIHRHFHHLLFVEYLRPLLYITSVLRACVTQCKQIPQVFFPFCFALSPPAASQVSYALYPTGE
ncbi:MAG: hypothetical protein AAFN70_03995, partial [Planctomycetota bacterium]